jgi:hypothetical protein
MVSPFDEGLCSARQTILERSRLASVSIMIDASIIMAKEHSTTRVLCFSHELSGRCTNLAQDIAKLQESSRNELIRASVFRFSKRIESEIFFLNLFKRPRVHGWWCVGLRWWYVSRFYFSPSLVSLCGGAYPPLAAGIFPPRLKFPRRDAILIAMIRRA